MLMLIYFIIYSVIIITTIAITVVIVFFTRSITIIVVFAANVDVNTAVFFLSLLMFLYLSSRIFFQTDLIDLNHSI